MARSMACWKEGCRHGVMRTDCQIHFHIEELNKAVWKCKLMIGLVLCWLDGFASRNITYHMPKKECVGSSGKESMIVIELLT